MAIFKFLLAIEELLYEILLGLFFIPKTLYKIIVSPSRMYYYALDELGKKPEERFNNYLSPMLLFTVITIIPLASISFSPAQAFFNSFEDIKKAFDANFELKILVIGIYLLLFPLTIAVFTNWAAKMDLTRSALKPTFYLLCYAFIPAHLLSLVLAYFVNTYPGLNESVPFIIAIPPFWIIWRSALVIRIQTGKKLADSIGLAVAYFLFMLLILFLIIMIFVYTWEITHGPHAQLQTVYEAALQ
ncbi:MAG: Permease of the major facilitator superfamily [Crocinitomicaceae bacterium]|jgi:hypothetical protein|nr:Permease of the major facilitator superfamily [Crocinitomicaceae bacterium]